MDEGKTTKLPFHRRLSQSLAFMNFLSAKSRCHFVNSRTQQFIMMSSVYAQLLVVICVVFYICEIVSPKVPLLYFQGFYLFLYSVSLIFLLYIYLYLLHFPRRPPSTPNKSAGKKVIILESLRKVDDKAPSVEAGNETPRTLRAKKPKVSENDKSHGSLFLRIGAIAFGLGTMVYNGLEFGSFFEIPSTSTCYSVIVGVNPVLQMVFTFVQMYFIFVNSRLNIHKCKVLARFGLMHIVATNICVWIRTVGKESLHAIVEHHMETGTGSTLEDLLLPLRENFTGNHSNPCQKQNIMGPVVNSSSAFLYPFIVEYSLIGAAVLYVMWENIGKNPVYNNNPPAGNEDGMSHSSTSRSDRVNCSGSSKGLFLGLLLLVTAIIFLIVFFVLIHHEKHKLLAVYLSELSHISLMILTIIAIIIGFFRIKLLRFHSECTDHQRDILLRVAAFGLYAYSMFGIIAGTFSSKTYTPNVLVLVTSCLTILQVAMQSFFLADVTCRTSSLPEHDRAKPGRQIVTFLMIANLIMWIIYTFEMQKVEASPVQMEFFGFLAWTVIVRITLPLSIFYRFHSFITFAEVWKNSYKNISS